MSISLDTCSGEPKTLMISPLSVLAIIRVLGKLSGLQGFSFHVGACPKGKNLLLNFSKMAEKTIGIPMYLEFAWYRCFKLPTDDQISEETNLGENFYTSAKAIK